MTIRWELQADRPNPPTAHIPYWNPLLQADYCHADGEQWPCLEWRQTRPPNCKCSHVKHNGQCWSRACGCTTYRPETDQ